MALSTRRRVLDFAAIAAIILCLVGAAAPDFYRVRDVRVHRDLLRDINDAEQAYATAHPHVGFACSIGDLADAGFIDSARYEGQLRTQAESDQIALLTDSYSVRLVCRGRRLHRDYYLFGEPRRGDRPWLCSDASGIVQSDRSSSLACWNALRNQHPPSPPFAQP